MSKATGSGIDLAGWGAAGVEAGGVTEGEIREGGSERSTEAGKARLT